MNLEKSSWIIPAGLGTVDGWSIVVNTADVVNRLSGVRIQRFKDED